jgi:hypothetical protein
VGGAGTSDGSGGDGLGGGIYLASGANACFSEVVVTANVARAGSGGTEGQGIGGGIYVTASANAGGVNTSTFGNHASTSDDDIFGVFNNGC